MRGVDSNEAAVPEEPEHFHLEGCLQAQDEGVPLQSRSRGWRSDLIFVKYIYFH